MYGAAKGKGKSFGKGKGAAAEGGKGQGHTLPRTRLSAEKFTGTVAAWKGKYGWIKPGEEIEHEKASSHNGSLFCSKDDLIGVEALEEGATVEFHIWEDDSGLGAEEIVQTGRGKGGKAGKAGKGAAPAWGGGAAAKGWAAPAKGGAKGWGVSPPIAKPVISSFSSKGYDKGYDKGYGKGYDKGYGKAGDKGKGKGKNAGKGHLLPRTRVSAEKFTGTVSAWKGKYGWITPAEEISHEKAGNHKGGVFVSKDDLIDAEELAVGATVEFHIWEDSSGLGAEEVAILG